MVLNFNKYRYLGATAPEVPEVWKPIVLKMIEDIDRVVKPEFVPRWFLNFLYDKSRNKQGLITRSYLDKILNNLINNIRITQIKQKFATLRVYGIFNNDVDIIVKATEATCANTCEFCGRNGTTNVMVKSWVRNLCSDCKDIHKK